jgi:flagellar biosynthesis/type III secretory pathway M-ring protein FliF/YscJ
MKAIQKISVILLCTTMFYGQSIAMDVTSAEKKIEQNMSHLLDAVIGRGNYVVSAKIELKTKKDEKITRELTPIVESVKEIINHNDREEISDPGFPDFLSPSLIDLSMKSEENQETKETTSIIHKPMGYKEVETIAQERDEIARIRYTVIINEREKKTPGYNESKIRELIIQVSSVNEKRGDEIEIMYTGFSEQKVDNYSLNSQIKEWGKEKNIPMWMLSTGMMGILFLFGSAMIILMYSKFRAVIKRWEKREEKKLEMKINKLEE